MIVDEPQTSLSLPDRSTPRVFSVRLHTGERPQWLHRLRARAERGLWWLSVFACAALVEWVAISVLSVPA
ncbi:MAG: hypothetical protein H7338_02670 [Candidatus Sericytochromatia bacterium]|nr:hypothetical protein [Candidatus Sericytochromatia bacterium]